MNKLPDAETRRRKVFDATTPEALQRIYSDWARRYDADIGDELGFAGPSQAARVFAEHVSKEARVLDAGAGTGLVGVALHALGYHDLHALDASSGMLEEAAKKDVYRTHLEQFLGPTVNLPTDSFDAVVSVGTLTTGHVEPDVLPELVRLTRAGGHVIFTLVPAFGQASGYFEEMQRLEQIGAWQQLQKSDTFPTFTNRPAESDYNVWVFQVC